MRHKRIFLAIFLVIVMLIANLSDVFAATTTTTPPAPTLSYSPTAPTNGNVTVTIYYPSTAVIKQYKLGTDGTWTTYAAPVVLSTNVYVYARYQDKSGNWSTLGGYPINNIDKTPPTDPIFSASSILPTNQNITITIGFSPDSTNKQYKLGSSTTWVNYTAPVQVTSNTTIYARASDSVGNWTSAVSYNVSNIDKDAPAAPSLSTDIINPTNGVVNVSISYSADSIVKQYKLGTNGTWTNYSSDIAISSNTTVYARGQDIAGNWSVESGYLIGNIDLTPPDNPVFISSNVLPTNQNVILSIVFSSDSAIKQFKIDPTGIWTEYMGPFAIESNSVIYARSSDNAGNWTAETSNVIDNIDKTAPAAPTFNSSLVAPTNQPVLITINYSTDSSIRQYKLGATGTWFDYNSPLIQTYNEIVYARASDDADNWTSESSYAVTNIDTTAPEKPYITASTAKLTDTPVIISIDFSADSAVKMYKVGASGVWLDYTSPVSINKNGIIYAKSSDSVGNWSLDSNYIVSNIRKTVLGYTVKNYTTDISSYNSIVANTTSLNEIATATFSVDGLGKLTGTAPADQINYANYNGIRTKLMVSNNFDAGIAKQLLENAANRQTLKNNILNFLKTYNYSGVDIDIENIPAADRVYFTTFMSEIYSTLKPLGYGVSVAVQPKYYDSPNATWNYAYDYKALAENSDFLMIMTYDEHYPGGTAGSIASIDWVTSVIDYTLTVVPKEKIVLGMAAYGYDWAGTTTKAYSISNCYSLAAQYGSTINFDSATKSKFFTYTTNGVTHSVWFEDAETISYKLDLANSKDLKGVGIWRLGLENADYWSVIKSKLDK